MAETAFSIAFGLEPQFNEAGLREAIGTIQQNIKAIPDLEIGMQIGGDVEGVKQAEEIRQNLKAQYDHLSNITIKTKEYTDAFGETKTAITNVTAKVGEMKEVGDEFQIVWRDVIMPIKNVGKQIADTSRKYDNLSQTAKEWGQRAQSMEKKHKEAVLENVNALQSLISEYKNLGSGATQNQIEELENKITNAKNALDETVASTKRSASGLQNWAATMGRAIKQTIAYSTSLGLVRTAQRMLNDAIQFTIDLNEEMTKIQVLQAEGAQTPEEIRQLAGSYNELAQEMGATTIEIAEGSVEWLRQGKTIEETTELMRASTMMAKLGNTSLAESTEYLTSTLNSFNMEAEDAVSVVDKIVHIDNIAATSTKELAVALRYTAATAAQAGVSFEELLSYIATISSTTRLNAEQIGQAMKTLFTRMQDIKAGAIDVDGIGLNNVESALARINVELRDTPETFRDLGSVLEDIAAKWDTLNDIEQANIAKAIAGVRQQNMFRILMSEMSQAVEYQAEAFRATGTAVDRYGIYLESVEAKQNKLKASMEELYLDAIEDGLITGFYDALIAIVELIDGLGGLRTIVLSVAATFIYLKRIEIGVAFLDIAKAIKTAGTVMKTVEVGTTGVIVSMKNIALAAGTSQIAVWSLTAALKALWTAIAPFALPVAAIGLLVGLNELIPTTEERFNSLTEGIREAREELKKLNRDTRNINSLIEEYNKLLDIEEKTEEQTQRFIDVQNQLADLLPNISGKWDAYGNFVIDSSEALDIASEAMREFNKAQSELSLEKIEQFEDNSKNLGKTLGKLYNEWKRFEELEGITGFNISEEDVEEARIAFYDALDTITSVAPELGDKGGELFVEGLERKIGDRFPELLTLVKSMFPDVFFEEIGREAGEVTTQAYWDEFAKTTPPSGLDIKLFPADVAKDVADLEEDIKTLNEAKNEFSETGMVSPSVLAELDEMGVHLSYVDGKLVKIDGTTQDVIDAFIEQQSETAYLTNGVKKYIQAQGEKIAGDIREKTESQRLSETLSTLTTKTGILTSAMEEQAREGFISYKTAIQLMTVNRRLYDSLIEVEGGYVLTEQAIEEERASLRASAIEAINTASANQRNAQVQEWLAKAAVAAAQGNLTLAASSIKAAEEALGQAEAFKHLIEILDVIGDIDLAMPSFSGGGGGGGGGPTPEQQELEDQIDYWQDLIDQENDIFEEQSRNWQRAIEDLQRQIDRINRTYDKLIEPFQDRIDKLQDAVDASAEVLDDLKWQYQEELWALEDSIDEREDKIDRQEELLDHQVGIWEERIDALGKEKRALQEEIDDIQDALDLEVEGTPFAPGLKDQIDDIKDSLEELNAPLEEAVDGFRDEIDILKDTKDAFNEYIDAQKESLKAMKEEEDFLKSLEKKNKSLGKVKSEIALLALDDSEEATARRLELEEEAAQMEEEIAEDTAQRQYELQIKGLEDAQKAFEKSIDAQIEAFNDLIEATQEQIDKNERLADEQIQQIQDIIDAKTLAAEQDIWIIEQEIERIDKLIENKEELIEKEEERVQAIIDGYQAEIDKDQERIDSINAIIEEQQRAHDLMAWQHEEEMEANQAEIDGLNEKRDKFIEAIEARIAAIEEQRFHATRAHEDLMLMYQAEIEMLQEMLDQFEETGGGGGGAFNEVRDALQEAKDLLEAFGIDITGWKDETILAVAAVIRMLQDLGFTEDEIKTKFANLGSTGLIALGDLITEAQDLEWEQDEIKRLTEEMGEEFDGLSPAKIISLKTAIQNIMNEGGGLPDVIQGVITWKEWLDKIKSKSITVKTNYTSTGTPPSAAGGQGANDEPVMEHHGGIAGYHDGGEVETHHDGYSFAGGLRSNEVFAKLLKGEYVATEGQMKNFMQNILPSIMARSDSPVTKNIREKSDVHISLSMPIRVDGNMDPAVLPDMEKIANRAIEKINDTLKERGIRRNATKFSI